MKTAKGKFKVALVQSEDSRKVNHAAYMKDARNKWTDEERKKNAEHSKLRMRLYRERQKIKSLSNDQISPRQTRQEEKKTLEKKKKQTEYKRKYRAALHPQKKRRIREKDSAQKRIKRGNQTLKEIRRIEQIPLSTSAKSDTLMSPVAIKKAVYRVSKNLPRTPDRYAKIIKGLTTHVTPKRKAALDSEGIGTPTAKKDLNQMLNCVKEAHDALQGLSDKQKKRKREFLSNLSKSLADKLKLKKMLCAATGIKRKYFQEGYTREAQKKRRKDAIPTEIEKEVHEFYKSDTNSILVPDKKVVKKDLEQKHVMQMSLRTAWSRWNEVNPQQKMSLDKFSKLRPKQVLTQKYRKLYQCLCEYCENVKLKLKTINKLAQSLNRNDLKLDDEFTAVNESLCKKQEEEAFHKLTCIDRQCRNCGTEVLRQKLQTLTNANDQVVKWNKWAIVKTVNPKTGKDINKRQEIEVSGSPTDLVSELLTEVEFLSRHLFEAQWQQVQFGILNKSLPDKTVSLTIDFAENYTCFSQNEIQGAHWAKDSVTIHPCIALYRCPRDNEIVDECIDIISDDLLHDSHAVHCFMTKVIHHLKVTRNANFEHAYVISDGCAAQYKSRVPFMDVSCSLDDYGITIERCFYGSRHGKNRCDGEAGVLKSKATRSVKNKVATISNAKMFYDLVHAALEKKGQSDDGACFHKRRTFLYVDRATISHDRPDRDAKTVPGTRALHSVIGVKRGAIRTRRLSCFCTECISKRYDLCLQHQYVDNWKDVKMKRILL